MFDFAFEEGSAAGALAQPGAVVLTASAAERYFGAEPALGRELSLRGRRGQIPMEVAAVVADPPLNSHVQFEIVGVTGTFKRLLGFPEGYLFDSHSWPPAWTYVRLGDAAQAEAATAALNAQLAPFQEPGEQVAVALTPIEDIHLRAGYRDELSRSGSAAYVALFIAIALFVLVQACVNFVNFSTAQATERAREVGVRKTLGAGRRQLTLQFLGESTLTAAAATLLGLVVASMAAPFFDRVIGLDLSRGILLEPAAWAGALALTLVIGVLAGAYPAFVLSRYEPKKVLRGGSVHARGKGWVRTGLVGFQFWISVTLIVATAIVFSQFRYLQEASLGFDEDRLLVVSTPRGFDTFADLLRGETQVESVTSADLAPGLGSGGDKHFERAPFRAGPEEVNDMDEMILRQVGEGFFETLSIPTVAGRTLSDDLNDDGSYVAPNEESHHAYAENIRGRAVVLNEAAAQALGWSPDEAIGQELRFAEADRGRFYLDISGEVVGVVADYHAASLRDAIEPAAFTLKGERHALVRLRPGNVDGSLATVRAAWQRAAPDLPFEYDFLEDQLAAQYEAERRLGHIVGLFAMIAVSISCLGLLGLATFTARRREKEVGVRKVLGASTNSVVVLFLKDLVRPVGVALVLSIPVAVIAAARWLEGFAYRIELGPGPFVLATAAVLIVAVLTVGYQAWRTATADPVTTLSRE